MSSRHTFEIGKHPEWYVTMLNRLGRVERQNWVNTALLTYVVAPKIVAGVSVAAGALVSLVT